MKNFKKLIKEAYLGNPLNEDKLPDGFHSQEDLDQFLRDNPFDSERYKKLSIAQKQDILSYLNRDTEKEFERRMSMREEFKNEIESGDVVVYNDEEHTVQYILDDDLGVRVYIRPNEKSYYGGRKDMFWVEPEDLKLKKEVNKEESDDEKMERDQAIQSYKRLTNDDELKLKQIKAMLDKERGKTSMEEDMNDPVLIKTRAAQMKRDKIEADEKAKKSYLDTKYGPTFTDKLEAEIDLKNELKNLEKEREDILMRIEDIGVETEETAEPEGGEKADDLADRLMAAEKELRAINNKIIDVKDELGYFRMYESVNEVTQKEIDDIENSGNIDIAYKKAMKLLNSLKDTDGDDITIDPDTEFKVDLKHLVQKHKIEDVNEIVSRLPVEELTDEALTRLRDQFLTTGTRPNAAEMDLLKSVLDEMGKRGLEESINEGTCGYTPDGKPRSKPAGPYLNEDDIEEEVTIPGSTPNIEGDELIGNEDLAENILKKIFGPKLNADVVTTLSKEISDIIGRMTEKDLKSFNRDKIIAQELVKGSNTNPKDLLKSFIEEESDATNESKEFNFNKMIKEALTPNYLK